jgi:hypothetical protein
MVVWSAGDRNVAHVTCRARSDDAAVAPLVAALSSLPLWLLAAACALSVAAVSASNAAAAAWQLAAALLYVGDTALCQPSWLEAVTSGADVRCSEGDTSLLRPTHSHALRGTFASISGLSSRCCAASFSGLASCPFSA